MEKALLAEGLGWPEGPAVLPDGRVCFVETFRSQIARDRVGGPRPLCLHGGRAELLRGRERGRALCLPERRHGGALARRGDGGALNPTDRPGGSGGRGIGDLG